MRRTLTICTSTPVFPSAHLLPADIALSTVRLDWWHGHQTLVWLEEAHSKAGVAPLTSAEEVVDIANYLDGSLGKVIGELDAMCTNCEVGLTPKRSDMTYLSLADFICSDFDSVEGSAAYPSRDCTQVDTLWAASPSSLTAPCCTNATLVRASVAMMTEALAYGITELPLQTLLSGGTDPSYSSTEYFVQHYIDRYSFILQLIVSRDQRMVGVSNYASKTASVDAPSRVNVVPGYWSFNYQASKMQSILSGIMLVGGFFTFAHDRRLLVDHFWGNAALLRAEAQEDAMGNVAAAARTWMEEFIYFSARWSAYVVLIEIPSILLPLLFEFLMPFLQVCAQSV